MFMTALARADSRRRCRRRRRRRSSSSSSTGDGRRRTSSWLWRRIRHRRPSRRRRWRRLLCRCLLCSRRRRGSRCRRRSHGATCTLAGWSEGGRTGPRRWWGEYEDETLAPQPGGEAVLALASAHCERACHKSIITCLTMIVRLCNSGDHLHRMNFLVIEDYAFIAWIIAIQLHSRLICHLSAENKRYWLTAEVMIKHE